jgi:hypothetical protein
MNEKKILIKAVSMMGIGVTGLIALSAVLLEPESTLGIIVYFFGLTLGAGGMIGFWHHLARYSDYKEEEEPERVKTDAEIIEEGFGIAKHLDAEEE